MAGDSNNGSPGSPTEQGRSLTEEVVFMRTKSNRIDLIRNLNLWGQDLKSVDVVRRMPNLEVLSLSVNMVSSLECLRNCHKLAELYLRKNDVYDLEEVLHLTNLRHLRTLWLSDNPCAGLPHYRQYVLHHLPRLTKLDAQEVSEEERRSARHADMASVHTCVRQGRRQDSVEPSDASDANAHSHEHADITRMPARRLARSPDASPSYSDRHGPALQANVNVSNDWGVPSRERSSQNSQNGLYVASPLESSPTNVADPSLRGMLGEVVRSRDQHHQAQAAFQQLDSPQPQRYRSTPVHDPEPSLTPPPSMAGVHGGKCHSIDGSACGERNIAWDAAVGEGMPCGGDAGSPSALPAEPPHERVSHRADNVLCAVLALTKELDRQGLELVRRAVEQRLCQQRAP